MDNLGLRFLYDTFIGRFILRIIVSPWFSKIIGKYLCSPKSVNRIKNFVIDNNIDLDDYEEREYESFNDFFTRKLKSGARLVSYDSNDLISPCDGLVSAFKIHDGLVLSIKNSSYTIESLLQNEEISSHYDEGIALVFRLCPHNYHRYHYLDDCIKSRNFHIDGKLHTVRPIALARYPVFVENTREYSLLKTNNFGTVTQIEVGALLVSEIHNNHEYGEHKRGEEMGYFSYGGSTIVLLFQKDSIKIDEKYFETSKSEEIEVKYGEIIGKSNINNI